MRLHLRPKPRCRQSNCDSRRLPVPGLGRKHEARYPTSVSTSTPRRLLLRLQATCNNRCDHCTVGDLRELPDRPTEALINALSSGREEGCTEVVFLRGEPTIREDFLSLCRSARSHEYRRIQVQTNGRMFAVDDFLARSRDAGLTHAESSLYGPDAGIHDAIARAPGAFEQSTLGLEQLAGANMLVQVNVPIVEANVQHLANIVEHVADRGAPCVQFNFQRPIPGNPRSELRLKTCVEPLSQAIDVGTRRGVQVKTEAFPLCLLPPGSECPSDAWDEASAPPLLIDDLQRRTRDIVALRAAYRGQPEVCAGCAVNARCPTTWAGYFDAHGSAELTPF